MIKGNKTAIPGGILTVLYGRQDFIQNGKKWVLGYFPLYLHDLWFNNAQIQKLTVFYSNIFWFHMQYSKSAIFPLKTDKMNSVMCRWNFLKKKVW